MKDAWNKCDRRIISPETEDQESLYYKRHAIDLLYKSFDPNFGGFCSDKSIDYIKKAINLIEKT